MIDPFSYWNRMMAAGFAVAETGLRLSETLGAAHEVVGTRSGMIGAAMRSPLTGDHAELGRMVPEKMAAFGKAGSAALDVWSSMGAAWISETQNIAVMALRGRPPTLAELGTLADRTAAYSLGAVEASAALGTRSLAPVHRTATGNAKRLRKQR